MRQKLNTVISEIAQVYCEKKPTREVLELINRFGNERGVNKT